MEVELLTTRLAVTGFGPYMAALEQVDRANAATKATMTGMVASLGAAGTQGAAGMATLATQSEATRTSVVRTSAATDAAAISAGRLGGASRTAAAGHMEQSKALKEVSREARGGIASFTGLGRAMFFASNAFLGGALVGGALKSMIDATRNQQEALDQLRVSVKDAGGDWALYRSQVDQTLTAQSDLSQFTKTDLAGALTRLVQSTGSVTKGEDALAVVTNLARARHEDLQTAVMQVVMAETGRTNTLRGLGLAIPKVTTAEDALKNELAALKAAHEGLTPAEKSHAEVLAKESDQSAQAALNMKTLAERVAGGDQAFSASSAGGLAKFHRSLGDLEVAVGTVLLPDIAQVVTALSNWMDKLDRTGQAQRDAKQAADLLGEAFRTIRDVIEAADKVTGSFTNTVEALLALKVGSVIVNWAASFRVLAGAEGIAAATTAVQGAQRAMITWEAAGGGALLAIRSDAVATETSLVALGGARVLGALGALSKALAPIVIAIGAMKAFNAINSGSAGTLLGGNGHKGQSFTNWMFAGDPVGQAFANAIGLQGSWNAKPLPYGGLPPGGKLVNLAGYGPYGPVAAAAAAKYGVPANLFLHQINQESGFNPNAVSKAGALGIAQFMPGTAAGYHINPLDPNQALPAAAKMMASLYAKYHNWGLALAAYNAGSGTVDKYLAGLGGLPSETTAYVKAITGAPIGSAAAAAGGTGPSSPTSGAGSAYAAAHAHAVASARAGKLLPASLQEALYNAQTKLELAGGATPITGKNLSPQQLAALKALEVEEKKALDWLTAQHETGKALLEQDRERAALAKQLATTQKEIAKAGGATGYITYGGDFAVPLAVQVQEAKANALAALQPGLQGPTAGQLKLARQVKAAAMKAIESHKLTLQGLLDAWNEVARVNATLARTKGTIDTYHAVSTAALTAGLNLSRQQDLTLRERLASSAAHRGFAPNGPAAVGEPVRTSADIHIHGDVILQGVRDFDQLYTELEKKKNARTQRRGVRR